MRTRFCAICRRSPPIPSPIAEPCPNFRRDVPALPAGANRILSDLPNDFLRRRIGGCPVDAPCRRQLDCRPPGPVSGFCRRARKNAKNKCTRCKQSLPEYGILLIVQRYPAPPRCAVFRRGGFGIPSPFFAILSLFPHSYLLFRNPVSFSALLSPFSQSCLFFRTPISFFAILSRFFASCYHQHL